MPAGLLDQILDAVLWGHSWKVWYLLATDAIAARGGCAARLSGMPRDVAAAKVFITSSVSVLVEVTTWLLQWVDVNINIWFGDPVLDRLRAGNITTAVALTSQLCRGGSAVTTASASISWEAAQASGGLVAELAVSVRALLPPTCVLSVSWWDLYRAVEYCQDNSVRFNTGPDVLVVTGDELTPRAMQTLGLQVRTRAILLQWRVCHANRGAKAFERATAAAPAPAPAAAAAVAAYRRWAALQLLARVC